jgi:signal peptidase
MPNLTPPLATAARGLSATALILLLAGAVGLMALNARGARLLSVQTASMMPTFRPGDALVVKPLRSGHFHSGDIVSYRDPRHPAAIISHRLLGINRQTGWLTTQGDALHSPDPAFPPNQVVGRAIAVAPGLGRLLDWLRRPLGLALTVYVPASLIIGAEVARLSRAYAGPFHSARL